jgi:hypothetical protein
MNTRPEGSADWNEIQDRIGNVKRLVVKLAASERWDLALNIVRGKVEFGG